jgi:DNA-directed RNA polymerase specialized sigma24 family protein
MPEPFPTELATRIAKRYLRRFRDHKDYEDLVAEVVIATWRAQVRHPELALGFIISRSSRWTVGQWFRDPCCGDLVDGRQQHYKVLQSSGQLEEPFLEWQDDLFHQMEYRLLWDEFCRGIKPHYAEAVTLIYRHGWPVYLAARRVGISNPSLREGLELAFRRFREKREELCGT